MRIAFALLSAVVLCASGCRNNTKCTVGNYACKDKNGFQDGNVLSICSDAAHGGDADGEYVSVQDCAASVFTCATAPYQTPTGTAMGGACQPSTCGHFPCTTAGQTTCSLDVLETCVFPDGGCPGFTVTQDCTQTSKKCAWVANNAVCQ